MKSPLSPIVADIVAQDLEMTFLKKINHQKLISVVFIRYIDDITHSEYNSLWRTNSRHIQFLLSEIEIYHRTRRQFIKPFWRLLNQIEYKLTYDIQKGDILCPVFKFSFIASTLQKRDTMISLVDRIILLSVPYFHHKNLNSIIKILLDNGYLELIFFTIKKRLHKKFAQISSTKFISRTMIRDNQ